MNGRHADEESGYRASHRPTYALSLRTVLAVLSATMVALTVAPPAFAQSPAKDLTERVKELHQDIGKLTERYNGLRVRLKKAEKTSAEAKKTLGANEKTLETRRARVAQLAGSSYINGTDSVGIGYIAADNPREYLDQASMLYSLQAQHSEEVIGIRNAVKAATKAKRAAEKAAKSVQKLLEGIEEKKKKITKLVAKAETKLFRNVMAKAERGSTGNRTKLDVPIIGEGKAARAAEWALTQQLKPYVWGAEGPRGYDCSGLVMAAFQKVGIGLPHYTGDQWTSGRRVSKGELVPGDLVFFYPDRHHVGIYIGGGMMVHAPQTGDVVHVAPINKRPWAGAVRVTG